MSIANEIQRLQDAKADIKAAIEEKGVEVGNGTIDTYAEKIGEISGGDEGSYQQGYEDGKKSEYDTFWDTFQDYGKRTDYTSGFGQYFNDKTFKPKYQIKPTIASSMFTRSGITKMTSEQIDFSNCTGSFYACFMQSDIEELPIINISKASGIHNAFYDCKKLRYIEKIILSDKVQNYNYTFDNCPALEHLIIGGVIIFNISFKTSPLLDNESVQSIINCLKNLTGQTAQTLTVHKTVGEKLTEEQKATITAKNWILAF